MPTVQGGCFNIRTMNKTNSALIKYLLYQTNVYNILFYSNCRNYQKKVFKNV